MLHEPLGKPECNERGANFQNYDSGSKLDSQLWKAQKIIITACDLTLRPRPWRDSVRLTAALPVPIVSETLHCGIIHFISSTDQLGQFMNHLLAGLGGKYLWSHSLLIKSAHSLAACLFLSFSIPPDLTMRISSLEDPRPRASKLPAK